jgi:hypothetical protein
VLAVIDVTLQARNGQRVGIRRCAVGDGLDGRVSIGVRDVLRCCSTVASRQRWCLLFHGRVAGCLHQGCGLRELGLGVRTLGDVFVPSQR